MSKENEKITVTETETSLPAASPLTSLKEVLAIIETPVICKCVLDRRTIELPVRRAMSGVMEKRREIQRAVQPPYVKERNDYDMLNPQYLQKRDLATLQARSLTVYMCCPDVAALKPGLLDAAGIHAFVTQILPEGLAELIELTALAGGLDLEVRGRANFTSAAPSES